MTEILTESFCERCGTRYTFESTGRRRGSVTRLRVLSRGLHSLVMTDGLSVADAMAAARNDEARAASVEQLDAFHRTFNFCLGCRQYTCANCWNEPEGKCLTCAPDLSREILPAAFPDLPAHGLTPAAPDNGHVPIEAWPTADLPRPVQAAAPPAEIETIEPATAPLAAPAAAEPAAAEPAAQPVAVATTQPVSPAHAEPPPPAIAQPAAAAVEAEPADLGAATGGLTRDELAAVAGALGARSASAPTFVPTVQHPAGEPAGASALVTAPEPRAAARADPIATGRTQTASLLHRFRPARPQRLADVSPPAPATGAAANPTVSAVQLPAFEAPSPAEPAFEAPAAQPAFATAPPGPATAATPPVSGTPAQVVPAAPAVPPGPVTPAAPAGQTARVDVVPQPTWRMVAPDTTDTIAPDTGRSPAVTPPVVPGPFLRARPAPRPGGSPAAPWAARLASARPAAGGVWAESSRDVLRPSGTAAPAGVQACVSCGLPLSANARFCRRCGSRQD